MIKGDIVICTNNQPDLHFGCSNINLGDVAKVVEIYDDAADVIFLNNSKFEGHRVSVGLGGFQKLELNNSPGAVFRLGDVVECLGAIGKVVSVVNQGSYTILVSFFGQKQKIWFTEDGKIKSWLEQPVLKKLVL